MAGGVEVEGGEGDPVGGAAVVVGRDGEGGLGELLVGDGAGEEGGGVAVAAHTEEGEVEAGPEGGVGGGVVELLGVVAGGRLGVELPFDAMNIGGWDGDVGEEGVVGEAVVAGGVGGEDAAFVGPPDVEFGPVDLVGEGGLAPLLVDGAGGAAAGEGDVADAALFDGALHEGDGGFGGRLGKFGSVLECDDGHVFCSCF